MTHRHKRIALSLAANTVAVVIMATMVAATVRLFMRRIIRDADDGRCFRTSSTESAGR